MILSACTLVPGDGDTDSTGDDTDNTTGDTTGDTTGNSDSTTGDTTGDTTGNNDSTAGDTTGDTGEPEVAAIAFLRSQRPDLADDGEADDILLDVGDFEQLCDEPLYFPECSDDTSWRLSFALTVAEQLPGSYAASDLGAFLYSKSTISSPCELNGPFAVDGMVEVISISESEIVVELSGTNASVNGSEGEYTVDRC